MTTSIRTRTRGTAAAVIAGIVFAGTVLGGTTLIGAEVAGAQTPAGPTTSTLDGTTSSNAAASCWEIKQLHPASADGVYWLRTETLQRPDRFHCDMTTDGGGWVLVGRGREGWTFRDYGQSTPQNIRDNVTGPAAFAPGALPTETIDALIDGADVSTLPDGVRVRRATQKNPGAGDWQELRWNFADLTSWSWSFGGGHRLSAFSVNGTGGTGSNTKDSQIKIVGEPGAGNRNGRDRLVWYTYPWSGHGYSAGFSFGGSVDGENNSTSYLWERQTENNAIPFTQVYLRPRNTTPALTPIPDTGTVQQTLSPMVDDRPDEIAGGVVGVRKVEDSEPSLDTPVLAIVTAGDRVYVGGKFDDVRDQSTGQLVDRNYLAAFDRRTGAWIPSFAPQLDGTVFDLAVAGGKLLVTGQFSNVDGAPLTAGLAALDPITGAVVPGWSASMTVTGTTARPYGRAIDVENVGGVDWVYVGGNFSRITHVAAGGNTVERNEARLGRVRLSDGFPDNAFLPDVDGVPYDLDVANGRVHVVGSFAGVNGNADRGVSTVDATNGTVVAGYAAAQYTTPNVSRQYQQAVLAVGANVWQGGSEHNTHVYSQADYTLQRTHVTAGNGGDTQALAQIDGVVYQSSHGNSWIYSDATTWPGVDGYSRVDDYKWVGAFDADDYGHEASFTPSMGSAYTEGVWALHADVDGCLWFGGDTLGGPFVNGRRQYLESFSRFCQRDIEAPSVPTGATSASATGGGVTLAWSRSSDNEPGFVGYEILRNDRVVSDLVYGSSYTDPTGVAGDRYFVRAVDSTGNRSASTGVLSPGDNTAPTTPGNLAAVVLADRTTDLTWNASTDDVAVARYRVLRNGVEIRLVDVTEATPSVTTNLDLGAGAHWLQVQAIDAAGNESFKTPPVRVDVGGADAQRPTQPGNPTAVVDPATGLITVTWTASTDDTAVTGYTIKRNLVEVAAVDGATTTAVVDLGPGGHYIQIEAFDAAGNASYRTAPVYVEVAGADSVRPSTPRDVVGTVAANGSVDVTWTASTDNIGVSSYQVLRNGVEVAVVDGQTTTANVPGLGTGAHFIQVRAVDAAGNESFKTAPVRIDIAAADIQRPSTPQGLTAVAQADGTITVTWTASTDDVGVTSYRVLRNLAEVAVVDGNTVTASLTLGAGTHFIQVQALDAAGNESFRTAPVQITT